MYQNILILIGVVLSIAAIFSAIGVFILFFSNGVNREDIMFFAIMFLFFRALANEFLNCTCISDNRRCDD